ncbi:hypothetical protein [Brevibacillus aydinogluensis]|jgi:hypothetical protein|uniref:SUKH-4 immunity protein of toxin-antitoxin system n=1 Tax=Brevibacillus aydinogluensis TaxID=927786 RepID=A0AA48M7G4_9BACL|nr:hypothetical protein [Brevibacillus aydinogluensis]CAJ1001363.1 SUKH-4 immunity protein of toxin-antitoxin system [Brevibacillus aydinogluensis]
MGYGIDLLEHMRALEQKLIREGLDRPLEYIHFRFADNSFRYTITPPDMHVFAETGCDGIHYGFLTDFGRITDLEEASIVCVSPTDDPPLRIIARNLEDFFRLVVTIGSAGELGSLVSVRTPRQWERYWADLAESRHEEATDPQLRNFVTCRQTVLHHMQTDLGLEPIPDVMRYLNDLEIQRRSAGWIPTIDGLGVVPIDGPDRKPAADYVFPFADTSRDHIPLDDIRAYLAAAPPAHRCAFARDAFFWWVVDETSELWLLLHNVHIQH